jgi:hypothetical protein
MRFAVVPILLLMSAVVGCRKQTPAPLREAPLSGSPSAITPTVPESEVRSLVDAWLGAQNSGNFAAYQQIYATRFAGIKRAGQRVRSFDRVGWFKDRERMFQRPMQGNVMSVAIEAMVIVGSQATARIQFVQSFERGTFKDRGRKEMVLVREGGVLRIAREEMLVSEMERQSTLSELATAERGFFFLVEQGVVLWRNPGREAAVGEPTLLPESNEVYLVSSAVDEKRLDESVLRMKGRKLQIFDQNGPTCVATIDKISLLVRIDPHFGTTQTWSGTFDTNGDPSDNPRPYSNDAIAREAWTMAEPILVASLGGGCKVPTSGAGLAAAWARDTELPAPVFASVQTEPVGAPRAEVEKQVRRHPEVSAALKDFADASGGREEGASEPIIDVSRVVGKSGETALIVARFQSGDGCADFIGMTFIWAVQGSATHAKLKLLNDPAAFNLFTPTSAFDLDGDGRFELFGDVGGIGLGEINLLRPGSGYSDRETLGVTSHDCYC